VDFFCYEAGLVIELDGSQHYEAEAIEYDAERTSYLKSLGINVVRFSNLDVDRNFPGVCEQIESIVKANPRPCGAPPFKRGLSANQRLREERTSLAASERSHLYGRET
jgi:hypothetical protein